MEILLQGLYKASQDENEEVVKQVSENYIIIIISICTVPLKSKLTVPRISILDPWLSILEILLNESRVEFQDFWVESFEFRVEKLMSLLLDWSLKK